MRTSMFASRGALLALLVGSTWACSNDDGLMDAQLMPPAGPAASCYSIENVAQAGERPILAFDRYGKASFAAQEGGAINYVTNRDGRWASFDAVANGSLVAFNVTDAGVAQLAYRDRSDRGLYYASSANGFIPQLVDRGPWREAEPTHAAITIDGSGRVELFYSRADEVRHAFAGPPPVIGCKPDPSQTDMVSRAPGDTYWQVETLSVGNGTVTGVAADWDDAMHVVWTTRRWTGCGFDLLPTACPAAAVFHATQIDGTWTPDTVTTSAGEFVDIYDRPALVAGPFGFLHVAYRVSEGSGCGSSIRYAVGGSGLAWLGDTVDHMVTGPGCGEDVVPGEFGQLSMAVDAHGTPQLAYDWEPWTNGYLPGVYHAIGDGHIWRKSYVDDGRSPSLAMWRGEALIAYQGWITEPVMSLGVNLARPGCIIP